MDDTSNLAGNIQFSGEVVTHVVLRMSVQRFGDKCDNSFIVDNSLINIMNGGD